MSQRTIVANVDFRKNDFAIIDLLLKRVPEPDSKLVSISRTTGDQNLIDLVTVFRKQFINGDCANAASTAGDENFCHEGLRLNEFESAKILAYVNQPELASLSCNGQ
jgi:hypothetical protein